MPFNMINIIANITLTLSACEAPDNVCSAQPVYPDNYRDRLDSVNQTFELKLNKN